MRKTIPLMIPVVYIAFLILILRFAPQYIQAFSNVAIALLITFSIWLHVRRRWGKYRQGEVTRNQTFFRLLLDLVGLVLAFVSAILLGRLVSGWASIYGFWVGILVGCVICCLVALFVAKFWGKVTK